MSKLGKEQVMVAEGMKEYLRILELAAREVAAVDRARVECPGDPADRGPGAEPAVGGRNRRGAR